MYFATTNSYASGAINAFNIAENGDCSFTRGTVISEVGNIICDVGGGGIGTMGNIISAGMTGDSIFIDQQAGYARLWAYDWTSGEHEPLRIAGEDITLWAGTTAATVLTIAATSVTFAQNIVAGSVDADFDALTATSYGGIVEANLVNKTATEVLSGDWSFSVADSAPASVHSALTANNLYLDGKLAISGGDTFLRLNNSSSFSGGVFIPSLLRIDNTLRVGGATDYVNISNDGTDQNYTHTLVTDMNIIGVDSIVANSSIQLLEMAAAHADKTTYGQIWVKNTNPNELWFTDGDGTDRQIAFV